MENTKKYKIRFLPLLVALGLLAGCSTNPVTGGSEFTGLMSPQQEAQIGAQQHPEIIKEYGGVYQDRALQAYVREVGSKVAPFSERPDTHYTFTLLDSPMVNAFALPGGYVYVTRGTLAVADSEAQLAAVLGHEIGHVAARHQASRYSSGVVTSLGAAILAAAVGSPAVSDALSVGTNLYMSSYSRDQERQADTLGVRYLGRAGYDPAAMSGFLRGMDIYLNDEAQALGEEKPDMSYFSSHPNTGERIAQAAQEAQVWQAGNQKGANVVAPDRYLRAISGMTFGDGAAQGFARDGHFYHPDIGFVLDIPRGFNVKNAPEALIFEGPQNTLVLLDMDDNKTFGGVDRYMRDQWLEGSNPAPVEMIAIHGHPAATAQLKGALDNRPVELRLVAMEWGGKMIRLQIVIPQRSSAQVVDDLKRMTYSLRGMSADERKRIRPYRLRVVTAMTGDTQESLARKMEMRDNPLLWLRAINGLTPSEQIISGQKYKVVE